MKQLTTNLSYWRTRAEKEKKEEETNRLQATTIGADAKAVLVPSGDGGGSATGTGLVRFRNAARRVATVEAVEYKSGDANVETSSTSIALHRPTSAGSSKSVEHTPP